MKNLLMAIMLTFSVGLLAGCVVAPVGPRPVATAHWVPGHYNSYGIWIKGHYA